MLGEVALDGCLQVDERMECAAANAFPGQHGEEVLDCVQPRAGGWREVECPARMAFQPGFDLRVLVSGVVVDHGFDRLAIRNLLFDGVEEADELLVPVALHAAPDHRPVQHVERCKQSRRPMPYVIVRHGRAAAGPEWQSSLGAIERLDLALLVDGQHNGLSRRREIEARRLRHCPAGPLRDLTQRLAAGQRHDTCNRFRRNGWLAGLAGLVAQHPVHTRLGKALLPTPDHRTADAHLLSNPLHRPTASRGKDNLSLPDVLALSVAVRDHRLQPLSVRRTHDHACRLSHDQRFARLRPAVNHQNGSQH